MTKSRKLYFFVGTTAELIKLSPVIKRLKSENREFKIVASNQNTLQFDQLKPIFGRLSADYTFIMTRFANIRDIYLRFAWWVAKSLGNYYLYFRSEFRNFKKGEVVLVVHGDTVTALLGAVIAKLCGVELVHIESGLRSHSFLEPFPEEINRFVISWLANIHFCPNKWARDNLKGRGGLKVNTFHNTIGESTLLALEKSKMRRLKGLGKSKYFILVMHRQEHTLFNKRDTEKVIQLIAAHASKRLKCVFIMHHLTYDYLKKNKRLLASIKRNPNIILLSRLDYLSFVGLLKSSEFIATDGGSNQEEAYYLGKPCLILRNRSERIEGLGKSAVISRNDKDIIDDFIFNYKRFAVKPVKMKKSPSRIIVKYLVK